MTTAQPILSEMQQRGFVLHPLKGKIPVKKEWQKLTATPDDIGEHIEAGGNIGAVCGKASNITAIDLDSMLFASEIFNGAKIETLCAERTEGRGHVYFRYNPKLPASKHHDLNIEILSDGNNIVLPPSKHPSGDLYHWKNPDASILDMPAEIETNLLRLFKTEVELKKILAKCRHCFRDVIKRKPDMHGAEGREAMLAVCTDLKANGADEAHVKMFARLMYREKFDEGRTLQEWRNIDPAKTWTCEVLRAKLPAYVDLAECEKCDARKIAFQNRPDLAVPSLINDASFTDTGNAKMLVTMFGDRIRYCHPWKSWLCYNGKCWERDNSGQIFRYAKEAIEASLTDAENELRKDPNCELEKKRRKHALFSLSAPSRKAMVFLAESELDIAVMPHDLDTDDLLLNTENGILNLETGELLPHDPKKMMTMMVTAPFDKNATAPTFTKVINDMFEGNQELIKYMQVYLGSCLTGQVRYKQLGVLHGKMDAGKTTLTEHIMAMLLNNYADSIPIMSLLASNKRNIPNDIAKLVNKRFVYSVEPEFGDQLSESQIKKLTGRDAFDARFLNQEWFRFMPKFKLFVACNSPPGIKRGGDEATWNRIKAVPFRFSIPKEKQDPDIPKKLKAEASGILNWLFEGCLEWQKIGMPVCKDVEAATQDYKIEQDKYAEFLNVCCLNVPKDEEEKWGIAPAKKLYEAYKLWCEVDDMYALSDTQFGAWLKNKGYQDFRPYDESKRRYRGYRGIRLVTEIDDAVSLMIFSSEDAYTDNRRAAKDIIRHIANKVMPKETVSGDTGISMMIRDKLKEKYDHFNKPDSILDLGRLRRSMEGWILNEIDGSEVADVGRYVDDYCKARQWV